MKTLLTIFTLLFSTVMFSTPSYSKWTMVSKNASGTSIYVDFERIRKVDGFVYFWELLDYLKPSPQGHLSSKYYIQGDCKLFRYKGLSSYFHKEPLGGGTGETFNLKNPKWNYPPPNSVGETTLKSVCSR